MITIVSTDGLARDFFTTDDAADFCREIVTVRSVLVDSDTELAEMVQLRRSSPALSIARPQKATH